MLPKPDKSSKKTKSVEQLDLVSTIDNSVKVESKRRLVIWLLFITVGLSIAFSLYRWFSHVSFYKSLPRLSFHLPSISVSTSDLLSPGWLKSIINLESWSISLISIRNSQVEYLSGYNSSGIEYDLGSIIKNVSSTSSLPDSLVGPILPQGIQFSETIITQPDYLEHQLLVKLPSTHYLIISRSNSPDPQVFRNTLPRLIESIYWRLQTIDSN